MQAASFLASRSGAVVCRDQVCVSVYLDSRSDDLIDILDHSRHTGSKVPATGTTY
mgnify:CR=1 FL=1